jgi:glycosyltransferase involved in cell wall biosynthesis
MDQKPRILIFGQPFNNLTGGGITLSNLLKGWPKDNLAVLATGHMLYYAATDICDRYYQLGEEEHKWIFPFNKFQRHFPSGEKKFEGLGEVPVNRNISSLRFNFVNHFFYPFLSWFGLMYCSSTIRLSKQLLGWLSDYKPEVLYIQVSNRETINFCRELTDYLKIPAVIHFMDDWPSTICTSGLFKKLWKRKIEKELRLLLDKMDVHLSISDAMAEEYEKRYNRKFIPFHNPIDLKSWLPFSKTDYRLKGEYINCLYSGRIGIGIAKSIIEVANAIDELNTEGLNIEFHIQTPTEEENILTMLRKISCVRINPLAVYSKLPAIFSAADILILANDFDEEGITYLRFSMPTKASEYMISGAPVLLYAPEKAAVYSTFSRNECGYCIHEKGKENIKEALKFLISDQDYRTNIGKKAIDYAKKSFDADIVSTSFQNIFVNLLNKTE